MQCIDTLVFDLDGTLVSLEEYVKLFVDMQNRVFSKCIEKGTIKPHDDIGILKELKNEYRLALLTNTPYEIMIMELEAFGLENIFEKMLCSKYKGWLSKPDKHGVSLILYKMKSKAENSAIVGDADT